MKNKKTILELIDRLNDLDYFIFAGFAIYLYTKGKRKFQDIDIILSVEDLNKFANRIGGKVKERKINKGDLVTKDLYFEINYKGQDIEAISALPEEREDSVFFEKQLYRRIKINFFGKNIFLAPKEGLVIHKAITNREKDFNDLLLLKDNVNIKIIRELAMLRKEHERIFEVLRRAGYNL
jgi:hypothetical protein